MQGCDFCDVTVSGTGTSLPGLSPVFFLNMKKYSANLYLTEIFANIALLKKYF